MFPRHWSRNSGSGVLAIVAGSAGGQLLLFLSAPILSRIYSPEDFGAFVTVSALSATLATVASARFELAIPLPQRDTDAYSLAILGASTSIATVTLSSLAFFVFGDNMVPYRSQAGVLQLLWFVPLTAGVMAIFLILNQLAIRGKRYGAIARRNILQCGATAITQIGMGGGGFRPAGLVVGVIVGYFAGTSSLLGAARSGNGDFRKARSRSNLFAVARRYRRFPLVLGISGLINVLGTQLPVLLFAYLYGGQVAGWLGLTQKVLAVPVALVGVAIAQVYLAEIARSAHNDLARVRSMFVKASGALASIGLIGFFALLFIGPELFSVLFGERWENSGSYARTLAVSLLTQFVAVPLLHTLTVFEEQTLQLSWDVFRLAAVTAAIGLSAFMQVSPDLAMWAYSAASAAAYGVSYLITLYVIVKRTSTRETGDVLTSSGKASWS